MVLSKVAVVLPEVRWETELILETGVPEDGEAAPGDTVPKFQEICPNVRTGNSTAASMWNFFMQIVFG